MFKRCLWVTVRSRYGQCILLIEKFIPDSDRSHDAHTLT